MKIKKILTFFTILFCVAIANGQNVLVINLFDNTNVSIPFCNIQKLTFDGDNMLLKSKNGVETSYLLDNITSITFLNEVGIKEVKEIIEVNVFINGYGEIVVESPHRINKLTVFDLTGKEVTTSSQNRMNVNFLPTGLYVLQVETDKGLVAKKFIKNR